MALRDILVQLDISKGSVIRTEAAIRLAKQHRSHIAGLFTIYPLSIPGLVASEFTGELFAKQKNKFEKAAREAEQEFMSTTGGAGVSSEWRVDEGLYERLLCENARYVDLLVLGQLDVDDPKSPAEASPEGVVLKCGRPALIIPFIGIPDAFPDRALIAWNGERESLRAVNDALPILQRCSYVKVASFIEDAGKARAVSLSEKDIVRHLGRHGVVAQAQIVNTGGIDVGDALLSFTADEAVDLLVMGCYGHSRFRELLLGGVTKHIFAEMTVPILMSH